MEWSLTRQYDDGRMPPQRYSAFMQDFRKLLAWQKAHAFALEMDRLTRRWPRSGTRSLGRQVREAAQSIPANVAEGCGRDSSRDMARFLQMAIGSSTELEYHLLFAGEARMIPDQESRACQDRVIEIRKMLIGLQRRVKERITKGRR